MLDGRKTSRYFGAITSVICAGIGGYMAPVEWANLSEGALTVIGTGAMSAIGGTAGFMFGQGVGNILASGYQALHRTRDKYPVCNNIAAVTMTVGTVLSGICCGWLGYGTSREVLSDLFNDRAPRTEMLMTPPTPGNAQQMVVTFQSTP